MYAMAKKGRRGRPRKLDAARQPDGRVRPHIVGPTPETKARRAELLAPVIAKYPMKAALELAMRDDAGSHIGRLYLVGQLTERQKAAAERYRRAIAAYESLLGVPKGPHAIDMNRIAGGSTEDEDTHTRKFRRAKRAYDTLHDAIAAHGHDVVKAVTDALHDRDVRLDWLRRGLDAIDEI